jgi:mersacidin/lichenicidin family type 2 lantibiotic
MTSDQIVSSWKNEDYRLSPSFDEQALLPEDPAGRIELTDEDLLGIAGGSDSLPICFFSVLGCTEFCTLVNCLITIAVTVVICPQTGG